MNRYLCFSHLSLSNAIQAALNGDTDEMRASLEDSNNYLTRAGYDPITAEPRDVHP